MDVLTGQRPTPALLERSLGKGAPLLYWWGVEEWGLACVDQRPLLFLSFELLHKAVSHVEKNNRGS